MSKDYQVRLHSLPVLSAVFVVVMVGCVDTAPTTSVVPTLQVPQNQEETDWYSVFFTDPDRPNAATFRGGPDSELARAIDAARVSVDMAIYDLNLWSIRDALLAAHRRGVTVRLVVESDNLDEPELQELKLEGIPVLGDRREGLMHNKFTVIDRREVWTGSMNLTTTDGYLNNNHLIRLRSTNLAENFTTEFEEMFVDDLFGTRVRADTPYPDFEIDQTRVEVYFSPDDGTSARLVALIDSAEESIHFLAFSFTADPLADALLNRAAEGLPIAGVFEASQVHSNTGSDYEHLLEAGLDVRLDSNSRNMHHKVFIFDEKIVAVGSYNFSMSAETRNDENTVILHDPVITARFMQEFREIFESARR